MVLTFSQMREQAFILVFEKIFNSEIDNNELYAVALDAGVIIESNKTLELFKKTAENTEDIDIYLEKYLKKWTKDRISKVSLAVLRLAFCEILYFPQTPKAVVINEAVELSKTYGVEEDYSFVNGLLSAFVRDREE